MAVKKVSLQKGVKAAKTSSFVVALIALVKGIVGLLSGSISLFAQAIDSLTDIFSSFIVYTGLNIAQKKPTEKFPYGYYKAETLASLLVAALIIVSGVEVLRESITRFLNPEVVLFPYLAMSTAALSIPFLYVLARYNKKVGEEVNSQAVVGQAKDFVLDVYASILVFVGVLSSYLGVPWIEALISVLISVFILKTGAGLGRDSILNLMDAAVKPEQVSKIRRLAEEVPGVIGVHEVKIRKSGPFCFGEMRLEVEEGLSVDKAHMITEEVEMKARAECKNLEGLMIHMEPLKRERFRIAVPIEELKGFESTSTSHFGGASHFIIVDVDHGEIKEWIVKPNPGAKLSKKRGISAADFLIKEKVNTLLAEKVGEGPFHVLRDGLVEIYKLPKGIGVRDAVEAFNHGKLEKVMAHNKP